VLHAPEERGLMALVRRLDREIFRAPASIAASPECTGAAPLPLERRKLHVHVDWPGLGPHAASEP
jgi:hypothetical protein